MEKRKRIVSMWDYPKQDVENKTRQIKGDPWIDSEGNTWIWNKPKHRFIQK